MRRWDDKFDADPCLQKNLNLLLEKMGEKLAGRQRARILPPVRIMKLKIACDRVSFGAGGRVDRRYAHAAGTIGFYCSAARTTSKSKAKCFPVGGLKLTNRQPQFMEY